jgi:hypothetical protein
MRIGDALLIAAATGLLASACGSSNGLTSPTSVESGAPVGSVTPPATGDRGPAPVAPPLPPDTGTCISAAAMWAIGQTASEALLERARVAAQASVARFIRAGQPITTEYLRSRLNLLLGERDDVVRSAGCG